MLLFGACEDLSSTALVLAVLGFASRFGRLIWSVYRIYSQELSRFLEIWGQSFDARWKSERIRDLGLRKYFYENMGSSMRGL